MSDLSPLFTWRSAVASKHGPKQSTTRHLLLTLSLHMNEKGGSCFPSTKTLAEETGYSERTICTHLQKAADQGWLIKGSRGTGGKGWKRNKYSARIPAKAQRALKEVQYEGPGSDDKALKQVQCDPREGTEPLSEGTEPNAEGTEPDDNKALKEVQCRTSVEGDIEDDKEGVVAHAPRAGGDGDGEQAESETHDLTFLPERDRKQHLGKIQENLRWVQSDTQSNSGDTGTRIARIKARIFGGGSRMNGEEQRRMLEIVRERGWAELVAACTIAARRDVPLGSLDSVTGQWDKQTEPTHHTSGMVDFSEKARENAARMERYAKIAAQQKNYA